jgi:abortive infection bacteriophage resistance protein
MNQVKPILTVDEQIQHLKDKGVTFRIMDENSARSYLIQNNNYFKLTSYRKNYDKHPDGENKDEYINLDFAYLVDLSVIDMQLRYMIVPMALDIEHHAKLQILRKVDKASEDGYQIVQDYIDSLSEKQKSIFNSEINRNRGNLYCGDIINKYDGNYPIWAFLEIIPFGRLISLYKFCAERFADKDMENNFYRLLTCKEIRNASAHSNCILNDLKSKTTSHSTNAGVTRALMNIDGMNSKFRKNRMRNARVQQIVTLLYMHKEMVSSNGVHIKEAKGLHEVLERACKNKDYYKNNPLLTSTFDFLKMTVDSWFSCK